MRCPQVQLPALAAMGGGSYEASCRDPRPVTGSPRAARPARPNTTPSLCEIGDRQLTSRYSSAPRSKLSPRPGARHEHLILISDNPNTIELFGREVAPSLHEAVGRERGTDVASPRT